MHPDATSTGSAGPIVRRFTKLDFRKKAGASREREEIISEKTCRKDMIDLRPCCYMKALTDSTRKDILTKVEM